MITAPVTEAELREAINGVLPCWCHEAYRGRGLTQPDCPRCNFAEDVFDAVWRLSGETPQ